MGQSQLRLESHSIGCIQQDQFASSFLPPALHKGICCIVRDKPTVKFEDMTQEAQHWMPEDSIDDASIDQLLAAPSNDEVAWQENKTATLTAESASHRQQLHQ